MNQITLRPKEKLYSEYFALEEIQNDYTKKMFEVQQKMTEVKQQIYAHHVQNIKEFGKSKIQDGSIAIEYDRSQTFKVLESVVKKDNFTCSVLKEKITPEKKELKLDKKAYDKLAPEHKEVMKKYLSIVPGKPTLTIKKIVEL